MEMFNLHTDRDPRIKNMITGKWTRINGDYQKFNTKKNDTGKKTTHINNTKLKNFTRYLDISLLFFIVSCE
jgi:hypothetical protein